MQEWFGYEAPLRPTPLPEKYTTSITQTKAARYEIEGIEDNGYMVLYTLCKSYQSGINVYSTKKILGVKSVSIKKLHGYGHLEDILVKRVDRQFYKFKEGDFVDLHLNDIEDILLLAVQHKLIHLTDSDIVDFIVALRVIYEDLTKQKRVMQADELYKFSDEMLKKVQDELHHRIRDFRLEYNKEMPRRKWMAIGRKRSELMVELIDKQMRERRIIQNLERLVGARELEMDYKLMTLYPVGWSFVGYKAMVNLVKTIAFGLYPTYCPDQ
ncbi:hypothetical protein Tco_0909240 [Tanacetum coccineum]|uniref:Uncharacterized protein n=1 Tax=Tanacetum coccineum TaxID=301880 RepID=A0ABQ5CPE8_9ASTR